MGLGWGQLAICKSILETKFHKKLRKFNALKQARRCL